MALCNAPKLVANWMMGELARRLNAETLTIEASPVSAAVIAQIVSRISDGTISNNGAKQVLEQLWAAGQLSEPPQPINASYVDKAIDDLGLKQLTDTGELDRLLDELLAANTKSVDEYRAGKEKAFNALVGQAMKATKGKANPTQVTELLKKKLG